MVVSALSGVNRRTLLALSAALLLAAPLVPEPLAAAPPEARIAAEDGKEARHRGEILGVDRDNGTFTLRKMTVDGKDLVIFHVTPETVYESGDGRTKISFSDLAAGMRATVDAVRRDGRIDAIRVEVKPPKKGRG